VRLASTSDIQLTYYTKVDSNEKEKHIKELQAASPSTGMLKNANEKYYKVQCQEACPKLGSLMLIGEMDPCPRSCREKKGFFERRLGICSRTRTV